MRYTIKMMETMPITITRDKIIWLEMLSSVDRHTPPSQTTFVPQQQSTQVSPITGQIPLTYAYGWQSQCPVFKLQNWCPMQFCSVKHLAPVLRSVGVQAEKLVGVIRNGNTRKGPISQLGNTRYVFAEQLTRLYWGMCARSFKGTADGYLYPIPTSAGSAMHADLH